MQDHEDDVPLSRVRYNNDLAVFMMLGVPFILMALGTYVGNFFMDTKESYFLGAGFAVLWCFGGLVRAVFLSIKSIRSRKKAPKKFIPKIKENHL